MAKLTPVTNQSGRIGQQVGAKASVQQVRAEEKRARALALEKARASSEKQKQQIQVDYESAWQEAKKHFNKGRAGAYIYHMKRDSSPKVQLVRSYLQQLVKQQRAGNISPTETGLAQVKRDIAREQAKIVVPTLKEETERILEASTFLGTPSEQKSKAEAFARQNIEQIKSGKSSGITRSDQDFLIRQKNIIIPQTISNDFDKTIMQPEITAYKGVTLPYGQKDIKWSVPQFGTAIKDFDKVTYEGSLIPAEEYTGRKDVSLIGLMKEQEVISPDISKPTSEITRQEADKLSNKIIKEETIKSQKIIDDSVNKIQSRIDSGKISLKEGEEAIKRIQDTENRKLQARVNKRFKKEIGSVLSTEEFKSKIQASQKFRDTFKTSFSPEYKKEQMWGKAELGGDIIAGALSGVAPPVGIAYFAGKGFYKAAKGGKEDIRMIDVSPSGELITPRYMGMIPSEESREAGTSLLFAGLSGIGATTKIGRDITRIRKAELIAKPWTISSKEVGKLGDETALIVKGSKAIPGASAEGSAAFSVKTGEKGAFKILGGKGRVDLRVVDFLKQGVVSPGDDVLKSTVRYSSFGRGAVAEKVYPGMKLSIIQGEGYVSPDMWQNVKVVGKKSKFWSEVLGRPFGDTYVKGTYVGDKVSLFDFGGVSRKVGKQTFFTSGRFTGAKLDLKTFGIKAKFRPEVWGETLVKSADDVAYKGYTSFSGTGGRKSSAKFLKDMWGQSQVTVKEQLSPQIIGGQFAGQTFSAGQTFAEPGLRLVPSLRPGPSIISAAIKPLIDTEYKITPRVDYNIKAEVGVSSKYGLLPKVDVAKKPKTKKASSPISRVSSDFISKSSQEFTPISRVSSKTRQVQKQVQSPAITPIMPTLNLFTGRGIVGGLKIPIPKFGGTPSQFIPISFKQSQGYKPQAKTKSGKWITLSDKPMSRSAALSRASRAADQTLSAQFRIKKVKGKVSNGIDNYFNTTQNKYRPYKIRKGKKVGLVNHFIEKRGKRLDTSGEKKGIKLAKYAKQQGWLENKKSKKKRNLKNKSPWLI